MKTTFHRILALLLLAASLTGCGLMPDQIDETKDWSASKLYAEAKTALSDANYDRAVQLFEKLESRYPFGPYAQQAQLEIAYAYYKNDEPASTLAACDRFMRLHPNHANVDYAYYLKGLANFTEDRGLMAKLSEQDMSERDPKAARESFEAFKELVTRFPESKYAEDATARMNYLVNALAGNEVHVARYYYKRGAYVAAANRSKYVLEHYRQAPTLEDALVIMAQSYDKLGLDQLRDDALRVLKLNFPNNALAGGTPKTETKSWWKVW